MKKKTTRWLRRKEEKEEIQRKIADRLQTPPVRETREHRRKLTLLYECLTVYNHLLSQLNELGFEPDSGLLGLEERLVMETHKVKSWLFDNEED